MSAMKWHEWGTQHFKVVLGMNGTTSTLCSSIQLVLISKAREGLSSLALIEQPLQTPLLWHVHGQWDLKSAVMLLFFNKYVGNINLYNSDFLLSGILV